MERTLDYLRNEPVRVRLYTVAVLVLGYLLARGVIDATDYEFAGALLLTILGVESARAKVTPVGK